MRKLVVALAATFVALLATGVYQAFRYRPDPSLGKPVDHGLLYDTTELVHRVGAWVFCALVVAVIVAWIRRERGTSRATFISVIVLAVLALATVAAMLTGRGLRWSHLALSAVTTRQVQGVVGLHSVKFVTFTGHPSLSWSEYTTRVFLHLVLFPVGIVLCGAVLWFLATKLRRRGRLSRPDRRNFDDLTDVTEAST